MTEDDDGVRWWPSDLPPLSVIQCWYSELETWREDWIEDEENLQKGGFAALGTALDYWHSLPGILFEWVDEYLAEAQVGIFRDRHLCDCPCAICRGRRKVGQTSYDHTWLVPTTTIEPRVPEDWPSILNHPDELLIVDCLLAAARMNWHIFGTYHQAVDCIVEECCKRGIDAADIVVASVYCRQLLSLNNREKYLQWDKAVRDWPACIPLLDLPADVRQSIMKAEAAVSRLEAAAFAESVVDVTKEEFSETESSILQALAEAGSELKADDLASKAVGKAAADGHFKAACSGLRKRGMLSCGRGRGSKGYAITKKGLAVMDAKTIERNGQDNFENE
jgi:hypothetical protein